MPFEARKTNFTVFSLNQELFNLIKSAFNMKLESKSTETYTMSRPRRRQMFPSLAARETYFAATNFAVRKLNERNVNSTRLPQDFILDDFRTD